MIATRRSFLGFLAAAPFVVKASSLMPVRALFVVPDMAVDFTTENLSVSAMERYSVGSLRDVMLPGLRRYQFAYGSIPRQWGKVFDAEKGAA